MIYSKENPNIIDAIYIKYPVYLWETKQISRQTAIESP
jgi:hypothetical protein